MILFDLRCAAGHHFEAWFRDGNSYEQQANGGEIACVVCGNTDVAKALMAPAVRTSSAAPPREAAERVDRPPAPVAEPKAVQAAKMLHLMRQMQSHIERNFEHVGQKFAEEARKIHYREAQPRSIYGDASPTEVKELRDEGIEVGEMPWLPRQDS